MCRSTGPTSAPCWRAVKERPSIECVQAKAWHLLIERFGFPERGGLHQCPSEKKGEGEPVGGQHVPFSGLVQAHIRGESRSFVPVDAEGTSETDWLPEGTGFEPSVPRQEKWSMPSSSDQTRVDRTLTFGRRC